MFLASLSVASSLLTCLVSASGIPQWPFASRGQPGCSDITAELGPLLSKDARIFKPGSDGFVNATTRWSTILEPDIAVVVMPAVEKDIELTIQYANSHDVPFLAIGGGHGVTTALHRVVGGIGIWTRDMNSITVGKDGSKAIIQAGAEAGEVTKVLFNQGKQVVSTACDCVGFMAPILGGGHGWLEGRYGLVTDNLISARMILANGTAVTVSAKQHPDLFWAIRGAGHNFGIVASVEYRIFDRVPKEDDWAYEEYIFAHDKLEALYTVANGMIPSQGRNIPVELTHYAHFENVPDVDPKHPIIRFWVIWQGPSVPSKYSAPIQKLGPISVKKDVVDITQLNGVAGAAYNTPNCGHGASLALFPAGTKSYNTTALRKAFNIYASLPSWLNSSAVLLEGYSTEGVHRVPASSTAFPDRFNDLLFSPLMVYLGTDPEQYQTMRSYGERIREAVREGSGERLYAYVNYAHGGEDLHAVYGYEEWRLSKLRKLKREFDPLGKFGYYVPIA